jgi:hypothetical protein
MNTEPFLPNQRKTNFVWTPGKTVLLWLLLVVLFFGIYELFTPPAGHVTHAHAQSSDDGDFGAFLASLLGGLAALWVAWALWTQRSLRRAVVMNGEGLELLGRGELHKAQALFETMGRKFSRLRTIKGLAQHNLAWAYLVDGQLQRATTELDALERRDGLATMPSLKAGAAADLALCYALSGQCELATPWLAEAEKRKPAAAEPLKLIGSLTLVRAVIACRQDQPAEATRLIDRDWHTLEGLGGDQLRPLRLLRAFALSAASGPRDDGAVDRLLAPLRESRPGSLRYLTVAWPELAAFMDLHHV